MTKRPDKVQQQLDKSDILDLRERRVEAVCKARPHTDPKQIRELVNAWYRGKPGSSPIGRIIEAAGLMYTHVSKH